MRVDYASGPSVCKEKILSSISVLSGKHSLKGIPTLLHSTSIC